jgi:hypothetical protein
VRRIANYCGCVGVPYDRQNQRAELPRVRSHAALLLNTRSEDR